MRSRRASHGRRSAETAGLDETRVFQRSDVRSRRRWPGVAGLVFVALALFLAGAIFGFYRYTSTPSKTLVPPEDLEVYEGRINILALGVDGGVNGKLKNPQANDASARSDVMILVSFDPETKEVGLLSIPRDTRAYIPGVVFDYEKIAHANAYGGAELAVRTVEQFLGVTIHYWVRVDFEGFRKAVDALGGVDVDVPKDMRYDDPEQDLHIDLKKGPQHLNGEQALDLVRYRNDKDADIGRIGVQEQFLNALIKKAATVSGALKIPELIRTLGPYIATDVSTDDILRLANMALGVRPQNVKMGMVPGAPQDISEGDEVLSYWIADREGTTKIVNELIRGISREKNATIRVAIENGNGTAGAADSLATVLRDQGFNVISVGNSNRQDYAETRVVVKGQKKEAQWAVLMGVRSACPSAKTYDGNVPAGADVLVIVGKDYKGFGP